MNYYNCIKGFLKIVYSTEYSILSSDYANSLSNISEDNKSCSTFLELTNAYVELMNADKYEDTLILHLMYSFWINPDCIALLTFSSIDDANYIQFWDSSSASQIKIKLNDNFNKIHKIFENWRKKNEKKIKIHIRKDRLNNSTKGDFITTITSYVIYNRFKWHFGGKLKCFNYKPQAIMRLSNLVLT